MLLLLIALIVILAIYLYKLNETYYLLALCKRFKTIDGSKLEDKVYIRPGKTIFGNNFDFFGLNPEKIFEYSRNNNVLSKGKGYLLYFLRAPAYSINNAEDAEQLFQSTTVLRKSVIYTGVKPFLGDGLLISSDHKWHSRRKMLTPAFHFNVLQSFNDVFKVYFYGDNTNSWPDFEQLQFDSSLAQFIGITVTTNRLIKHIYPSESQRIWKHLYM